MGIFGALTTAIAGLRSQSFALEHVSDNIANSQTIGFKRTETVFQDLVTESQPGMQPGGSVIGLSRATNTIAGDIQDSAISTHMSIGGDGYFIVERKEGETDGNPIFLGVDLFTRRGDFELDKNGQLINSAGYYLKGIPIDPNTGNPSGGSPEVITIDNGFLAAKATTTIDYEGNVPAYPKSANATAAIPGSELLDGSLFTNNPVTTLAAAIVGTGAAITADAAAIQPGIVDLTGLSATGGNLDINGTSIAIAAADDATAVLLAINGQQGLTGVTATLDGSNQLVLTSDDADTAIDIEVTSDATTLTELGLVVAVTNPNNLITQGAVAATETLTVQLGGGALQTITFGNAGGEVSTLAELSTALAALTNTTATVDAIGNISMTSPNVYDDLTIGGSVTHANFGITAGPISPTPGVGTVLANELPAFIERTIAGGAVTVFDTAGAPVDVQFRWGKISSDTWNLFHLADSDATGTEVAWRNVGHEYTFDTAGTLTTPTSFVDIANLTVDGISLGTVRIDHGNSAITQFADPNGITSITELDQNGFGSGKFEGLAVSDNGRIIGTYSNGEQIEIYEVTLASFNADSMLGKLDGGAFQATSESGAAIIGAQGAIIPSTLEGSNADIADEFSKLIVTQQAYSAGTRIVTTADEMMKEALNMKR